MTLMPDGLTWDIIIVGGGTAGLPAAIFSARRGARVVVLEAADTIGGTLNISTGQMSAAGTKLQAEKGIEDSAELHYQDVVRISKGTADPHLTRLAVDHAADTFDWLMELGFDPQPHHPVLGQAHEPYSQKRYVWSPQEGRGVLNVLAPLALAEEEAGRLTIHRSTRAKELILDNGAVVGVRAQQGEDVIDYHGATVLVTTGGYAMNPSLFEELSGFKQYGAASYEHSLGDGYRMVLAAGGTVRGKENFICGQPRIMASADEPAEPETRFTTRPEKRQPWEIQVNVHGRRYVAEDEPSVDKRENALVQQPDLRTWLIFDQAIFDAAPNGVEGWSRDQVIAAFESHPMFFKAESLEALAAKAGVDAAGLTETVVAYNSAQKAGHDPEFGRQHMPLPIVQAPFYAIRQQAFSLTSTVGVSVNDKLQVIREDGSVIDGLYAAGEILGSGQLMGKSAVGGMMVTPALTFGRLLGQSMLPISASEAA